MYIKKLIFPLFAVCAFSSCDEAEIDENNSDNNAVTFNREDLEKAQGVSVDSILGGYTYVDLGLSVKWATYNVGSTKPAENGTRFAWGETTPKSEYTWDNYKWCSNKKLDSSGKYPADFTKYCSSEAYGVEDSKSVLEKSDDAATANWGSSWRTPTTEEQNELVLGCQWEWTNDFNNTGVAGQIGKSKSNGKTIFLPADKTSGNGLYWSSSLNGKDIIPACCLGLNSGIVDRARQSRENGFEVRAVLAE